MDEFAFEMIYPALLFFLFTILFLDNSNNFLYCESTDCHLFLDFTESTSSFQ